VKFYQCTMEKKEPKSKSILTSWLPEQFASKGCVLELKDRDTGLWSNGWTVRQVSNGYREKSEVITRSQDHKKQRLASDI